MATTCAHLSLHIHRMAFPAISAMCILDSYFEVAHRFLLCQKCHIAERMLRAELICHQVLPDGCLFLKVLWDRSLLKLIYLKIMLK